MRPTLPHSAFCATLLFSAVLTQSLHAQCASGQPFTTGIVRQLSPAFNWWSDSAVRTSEQSLSVECVGIAPAILGLRISEPHRPAIGTVLFITGGNAAGYYGLNPNARPLFRRLLDRGYRVVDTSWSGGWFRSENEVGIKRQSCRVGTLIEWLDANVHTGGDFCAVGNSGGAGAISYALTTWSAGDYLDTVVLCGGPPMSRLDFTCQTPSNPLWVILCAQLIPSGVFTCGTPACADPTAIVCFLCPDANSTELRNDSVMHSGAIYNYPNTKTRVLLGALDCTVGVPTALFFYNALTSYKSLRFIPGTPHFVADSEAGRDAIYEALVGGDLDLNRRVESERRAVDLDLPWAPGDVYPMFLTGEERDSGLLDSPVGWVFVRLPQLLLGGGSLTREIRGGEVQLAPLPVK